MIINLDDYIIKENISKIIISNFLNKDKDIFLKYPPSFFKDINTSTDNILYWGIYSNTDLSYLLKSNSKMNIYIKIYRFFRLKL